MNNNFLSFNALRQPIRIGDLTIKNRFVASCMSGQLATEDDRVTQRMVDYYDAKAKGGFGLINIEFGYVEKRNKCENWSIDVSTDECIPGLKLLAETIHKYEETKAFLQLGASGVTGLPERTGEQPLGPTAIPFFGVVPIEYTIEEIYETIEHFGDAALRVKNAGLDGVDIHGGHGYLIEQFMSGKSNKRTDEFGGDFPGRMKFPELIIKNIKKKCGADFPVSMRFDADEMLIGGYDIEFGKVIARYLEAAGVDALNVSRGGYDPGFHCVPPNQLSEGLNLPCTAEIKKVVKIPVIAGGRMNDPFLMESTLEEGVADMIFLGRVSLADPAIPNKILNGELEDIIPCVGCLQRCEHIYRVPGIGISCMLNPLTGHEGERVLSPVEISKRIAVVGAGPSGMTAAWMMAKRGHDVTVYEKSNHVGGQYLLASVPPFKHNILRAIKNQKHFCDKYGVKMVLNTEITKEKLEEGQFDAVVLATGATPLVPNIPGIHGEKICVAHDVMAAKCVPAGKVLVIGGGLVGLETADILGENSNQVTVVEMTDNLGGMLSDSIKYHMLKRLAGYGVTLMTDTKVKKFTEDGAVCEANGEELVLSDFDSIVLAMGALSYNPLEEVAKTVCGEVHVIGDASKARDAMAAIEEAAVLAINI